MVEVEVVVVVVPRRNVSPRLLRTYLLLACAGFPLALLLQNCRTAGGQPAQERDQQQYPAREKAAEEHLGSRRAGTVAAGPAAVSTRRVGKYYHILRAFLPGSLAIFSRALFPPWRLCVLFICLFACPAPLLLPLALPVLTRPPPPPGRCCVC